MRVAARILVAEKQHIVPRGKLHLHFEYLQQLLHGGYFGRRLCFLAHQIACKHAPPAVKGKLQKFGGIVASVAPRRLFPRQEILYAAHHAVIPRIAYIHASPYKGSNIDIVIHKRGIAYACAYNPQAVPYEILGRYAAYTRRKVRAGDIAYPYRLKNDS